MQEKKQKQKPQTTKLGISQKVKAKSFKIHATVGITQKKSRWKRPTTFTLDINYTGENRHFFIRVKSGSDFFF